MQPTSDTSQSPPPTSSVGPAKDGARALEAARTKAEVAQTQLQALLALTDTALSHLTLDDLLRELLGRVTDVMGVDQVVILLLDEGGQTLTVRAARGVLANMIGRTQVAMGKGFPGRIAASQAPLIVNDPTSSDLPAAPPVLQHQIRALAGVPLLVHDPSVDQAEGTPVSRLVGVLFVGSTTPRRFSEADVQLLQRAADRIALAIDHALVYAAEQDAHGRAETALARALVSETQATDRAEQLQTVLETIADGVAVYDMEGRPIQTNRAYRELFALERGPANFESLPPVERSTLLHVRDATGTPLTLERNPAARALRGEAVAEPGEDLRARAFDGRELEMNVSAAPMRGADGRIVGAVTDVRDFTEHNRLEREREAARADEQAARTVNVRMEAFLATAAHDLRSPLTSTVGFLSLAQNKTDQLADAAREAHPDLAARAAAAHNRMEEASHCAERLTRLLNLLFDTAAIQADRLELHCAPFDLAALVREQVEAQRVSAPERTIRLRLPAGGKPVPVNADADRIGQVVTNYVTNALKYAPPDRPVDVSVEEQKDRARVTVRDAGPGIPKAEQAHVWELFHRAAGSAPQGDPMQGSLGLGLFISKAIIEAHEGQVGVKSAEGKGSTFWFTLPLSGTTPGPVGVSS
jgi:signal transduction histidine kinase